jgi:hypothetical protein
MAAQWQWKDDSGWAEYDQNVAASLEDAYQRGLPSVLIFNGYESDLDVIYSISSS